MVIISTQATILITHNPKLKLKEPDAACLIKEFLFL